jgi:hypothetical protein
MKLHNHQLLTEGIDDPETLAFARDLHRVSICVHQGMSIIGPWMEARIKQVMRAWLPEGWQVSGPAQVFHSARDGLRSRSWDAVVHRAPRDGNALPPPASPESGHPLLPAYDVAAVVDTKTNFADPRPYAALGVFNLMNDATERQLEFLGSGIVPIILAASSSRSPDSMFAAGQACGVHAFSMGRYWASPVSDGPNRRSSWRLERFADGSHPLQRYKVAILEAIHTFSHSRLDRTKAAQHTRSSDRSADTPPVWSEHAG